MYCNHHNPSISIHNQVVVCVCVCFSNLRASVRGGRGWVGGYADGWMDGWMDCLFVYSRDACLSVVKARPSAVDRHGDGLIV